MEKLKVNKDWTLFLDRDGVINKKLDNDYIKNVEEFEFEEGVLDLFPLLNKNFGRIIVVTNQQGIGKGLMSVDDLNAVHDYMCKEIKLAGGNIDGVYFAPQKRLENSIMRKPGVGMPLKAANDFPDIDFNKSLMVGDTGTDIEMGNKIGMKTIFLYQNQKYLVKQVKSNYHVKQLYEITNVIEL